MALKTVHNRSVVAREEIEASAFWPRLDEAGYPMVSCFLGNEVVVEIAFRHRLLLLFTGRLLTRTVLQTDAHVGHLRSASHSWVLWPDWVTKAAQAFRRSFWR